MCPSNSQPASTSHAINIHARTFGNVTGNDIIQIETTDAPLANIYNTFIIDFINYIKLKLFILQATVISKLIKFKNHK